MTHTHIPVEQFEVQKNFTISPSFIDLATDIYGTLKWYYAPDMWHDYKFPQSFTDEFTRHFYFPLQDVYYIIYVAIFLTVAQFILQRIICKPLVNWLQLTPENKKKFPESAWKFASATSAWVYCAYLLYYRYDYYEKPHLIWDDWSSGMKIPSDIKLMYLGRCGHAIHSVYAIFFVESKRKDFYAICIHHILTITLLIISYAMRYHKIGLLVLFVHDIGDVWLELTKLLHYMSTRDGGRKRPLFEHAASGGFVIFTLCWFVFRLYLYPLKVLYSTGVVFPQQTYHKGCILYGFFNSLLWILFGLNVYWVCFLLQFLYKLCTGALSGLTDTREYESNEDNNKK
ncbi:unnamed protein product [Adineta steineri]|uniref:TLC domain-containing protein n=2 Tax=Adineta steineri TaxID=433720 RepID=A0A819LLK9_9BILA|nr:unnamed protein product [Adineta steineri]